MPTRNAVGNPVGAAIRSPPDAPPIEFVILFKPMDDVTPESQSTAPADVRELYATLLQGKLAGSVELLVCQQMLQALMDSMGTAVFWKDSESRHLGANHVFASFCGYDSSLLVGKSDHDMPWADDDEYGSEWFIDWDQSVIESGEPQFGILERLRRADGDMRWIVTNKVPLRSINGEVIGLMGTFEDVTDKRRAEEELKKTLDDLDERVNQRTNDLVRVNEALRREVEDRIRLQAEERQQRTYAEALRHTAAAMSKTFDLETVGQQLLAGIERLVSSDLVAVVLADDDGKCEVNQLYAGFSYEIDTGDSPDPASLTVIERMAAGENCAILEHPAKALGPARSVLGARMQVADQLIGYLVVESATPGFFTEGHADRLRAMADQAGAALSNAKLAGRMSSLAAAEERQRLARDLHDAVNQTLWTAALTAESLLADMPSESKFHHRVERLRQLTRGALAEMRSLLLELRPGGLTDVDLGELIEFLLAALECRRTLDVTLTLEPVRQPPEVHIAFYRVAQEALGNVAQHAGASTLGVQLRAGPPVELVITDDGCGFDPDSVPGGHFGLRIMNERAEMIGATLTIESELGQGTSVRLRAADPK